MPQESQKSIYSVLFVCSANQCRSPMAEALLKEITAKRDKNQEWTIESAGCWASPDFPATDTACEAMNERNLDLNFHLSQPVTEDLLNKFELILCMESDHKQYIQRNFPSSSSKVFLLSEMIGLKEDIWDPIGMSISAYQKIVKIIVNFLEQGYAQIKNLSRS